ncbi:DnaJ domain-containing protein, partial [Chytriomyces sp. MP71]
LDSVASASTSAAKTKAYVLALAAIESAMILADPSNMKQTRSSSSSSRLVSADLGNVATKWKLIRAECLIGLLELGEAGKVISNQVLSYDSTNSEALAMRAQILYLNDSHPFTHVIQLLSNALAYDPDNKRARLFLKKVRALEAIKKEGNDAYGASNWDTAEEKYTQFLEDDAFGGVVRAKVLSNRAMVRSKAGRHSPCISDCTTAIELLQKLFFPTNRALFLKLHLRRADSYLKQEAYDKAVRDYHVCAEIKPEDREIAGALKRAQKAEKMAKRKDYYKILGVEKGADDGAVKKAYRKMALQYHPDKQAALPEEERLECDTKFKEISEAYSVLSDPQKKEMFDSGMDVDGASASGGMGGSPFGGGGGADMEDILRMFMGAQGGGFPGGGRGFGGGSGHQHGGHGNGGYGGGHSFHFG